MNEWIEITRSNSADQTKAAAAALACLLCPGAVLTLEGELGAGKTQFTQGLASSLGVVEAVTSPTFTVMIEYTSGSMPLYHFDLYRLSDVSELDDIAFWEYVEGKGISVVEWASKFEDDMPDNCIDIRLLRGAEENQRVVYARSHDAALAQTLEAWKKALA